LAAIADRLHHAGDVAPYLAEQKRSPPQLMLFLRVTAATEP
jgi:hypothetical protein